jgi:hypothetical protein
MFLFNVYIFLLQLFLNNFNGFITWSHAFLSCLNLFFTVHDNRLMYHTFCELLTISSEKWSKSGMNLVVFLAAICQSLLGKLMAFLAAIFQVLVLYLGLLTNREKDKKGQK